MTTHHTKIDQREVHRAEDAASMCRDSFAGYGACVMPADQTHTIHRDANGYGWEHEDEDVFGENIVAHVYTDRIEIPALGIIMVAEEDDAGPDDLMREYDFGPDGLNVDTIVDHRSTFGDHETTNYRAIVRSLDQTFIALDWDIPSVGRLLNDVDLDCDDLPDMLVNALHELNEEYAEEMWHRGDAVWTWAIAAAVTYDGQDPREMVSRGVWSDPRGVLGR